MCSNLSHFCVNVWNKADRLIFLVVEIFEAVVESHSCWPVNWPLIDYLNHVEPPLTQTVGTSFEIISEKLTFWFCLNLGIITFIAMIWINNKGLNWKLMELAGPWKLSIWPTICVREGGTDNTFSGDADNTHFILILFVVDLLFSFIWLLKHWSID